MDRDEFVQRLEALRTQVSESRAFGAKEGLALIAIFLESATVPVPDESTPDPEQPVGV